MEQIKIIFPKEFKRQCLSGNYRTNYRKIDEQREVMVNVGSDRIADRDVLGSSIARIGDTTIMCTIKLKSIESCQQKGSLIFEQTPSNIDHSNDECQHSPDIDITMDSNLINSSEQIVKQSCDYYEDKADAKYVAYLLRHLLISGHSSTSIAPSIQIELICISDDGSKLDTCFLALNAAIKDARSNLTVHSNEELNTFFKGLRCPFTFTAILPGHGDGCVLTDPDLEEESDLDGSARVVAAIEPIQKKILYLSKIGGKRLSIGALKSIIEKNGYDRISYLSSKLLNQTPPSNC